MLTAEQFDALVIPITELYEQYNQSVINDIARRLSGMSMTSTAAWQMQRLTESGKTYENALKELSKITGKSEWELNSLFTKAGVQAMKFDDSIYKAAGLNPLPINLSPAMFQVLMAGLQKTKGLVQNLTMSTAINASQSFTRAADLAYMQVSSGAMSYDQAIRAAVKKVANDGLSVIGYASGHQDQLDVAMRRTVLTGVAQTTGQLQDTRANEMGQDLVQTSAHLGARPTHQVWQGKVFSRSGTDKQYPDFVASTGYGTVTGLCGINCRHSYYPFFKGISQAIYDQAQLDAMNDREVSYNGHKIKMYDATQMQRGLERKIRMWKRQANALQAAGLGNEPELAQIRTLQGRLRDFTRQTWLDRQPARESIVRVGGTPAPAAPVVAPPPTPIQPPTLPAPIGEIAQGAPVSDALDLSGLKNKKLVSQAQLALAELDKVHSDGQLPKIPIVPSTSKTKWGVFYSSWSGPAKISLSTSGGEHQALTLLHEVGHFLDHSGFGSRWATQFGGEARAVVDVAQKSDWYTNLWTRLAEVNGKSVDGGRIMIGRKWVNYLASTKEVFARAYAQYIATKSGNPELLAQLAKLQGAVFPTQWSDEDFKPIADGLDALFKKKGWIQ